MSSKDLMPLTPAPPVRVMDGLPVPQLKEPKAEGALAGGGRWLARNRHFTVPLAMMPALWLAGLLLHQLHATLYLVLIGGAVTACVWFFAPHKWTKANGEPQWREVWFARLTAAWDVAWLTLASWLGPLSTFITSVVLAALLFTGCVAWGIPWFLHKRPRRQKAQARLIAQCDAWWQSHAYNWNLAGSRVIDAELSGVTLQTRIRGIPGRHTYDHFQQALTLIESAAEGVSDIGLIRLAKVKGRPSEVDIFFKRENPLRDPVEYDLSLAPQSVHEPAVIGQLESGRIKATSPRKNRFTIGKTRSGKSNDLLVGVANLSSCPDGRFVLIDLKGGRSARPVLKSGAAEYVITTVDEARMYLRLQVAEISARAIGAYDGNEQLLATREVPGLWTLIDETHGLTSTMNGDTECRNLLAILASQGSGLEIYVWVYTQFGSLEESVGSEQIRGNLPWRTCYAVAQASHGAYVIPEYNKLDASKLEEQGTCYDKDGPEVTPEQLRAPHMPHELLTRIAAQNMALIGEPAPLVLYCGQEVAYEVSTGELDEETGEPVKRPVTWQEWWDQRWLRLPAPFRADSPQYQDAAARYGVEVPGRHEAPAAHTLQAVPSPVPGTGSPAAAAAAITADSSLMAAVPADFRPDPAHVGQLAEALASGEDRFCHALQSATMTSPISPKQLMEISGFAKTWVHGRLNALAEIGQVTLVSRGMYAPRPGASIKAGLQEITTRNDKLSREAEQILDAA